MAAIAEAVRHMLAAGMAPDAVVAAIADMEDAADANKPRTARQARNARHYQVRKAREASENRLKASYSDVSDAPPSSPNDGNPNLSNVEGNLNPTTPPIVPPAAKSAERDEQFERFRKAYPRRKGTDARPESRKAFDKAIRGGAHPEQIIRAAGAFARSEEGQRSEFVPMSATWLNKGRYADVPDRPEPAPVRRAPVERVDPATWDDRLWRERISYARLTGQWSTDLGPPPGDPGCKAPPDLLKPADFQMRAA